MSSLILILRYYPAIRSIGRDTKFTVSFFLCMCVRLRISQPGLYTDRCEILLSGSATSRTDFLLFWGIAPVTAEFWASSGAIWWGMLLAEALVLVFI